MATTARKKSKARPKSVPRRTAPKRTPRRRELPYVLTLAEAAEFLRIPEREVESLTASQELPGRRVGSEWRFLKSALEEWLCKPPARSSKEAMLAMAGAYKDDPFLDDIVKEAYRQRGRPITEDGE